MIDIICFVIPFFIAKAEIDHLYEIKEQVHLKYLDIVVKVVERDAQPDDVHDMFL